MDLTDPRFGNLQGMMLSQQHLVLPCGPSSVCAVTSMSEEKATSIDVLGKNAGFGARRKDRGF